MEVDYSQAQPEVDPHRGEVDSTAGRERPHGVAHQSGEQAGSSEGYQLVGVSHSDPEEVPEQGTVEDQVAQEHGQAAVDQHLQPPVVEVMNELQAWPLAHMVLGVSGTHAQEAGIADGRQSSLDQLDPCGTGPCSRFDLGLPRVEAPVLDPHPRHREHGQLYNCTKVEYASYGAEKRQAQDPLPAPAAGAFPEDQDPQQAGDHQGQGQEGGSGAGG